uniref:Uncharacterized protein n=1 Tax=Nelumbo nucifera TaxID=4432 RepID=A0A822ZMD2_NELNU|nr:TPA_asm: hypothetical protein HUJ06_003870 [Nelumbo nucifera]
MCVPPQLRSQKTRRRLPPLNSAGARDSPLAAYYVAILF